MEARQHWWKHRDPSAALTLLRRRRGIEYYLFKGLIAHGSTSLLTAIMMVWKNLVSCNDLLTRNHNLNRYLN